MDGERRGEEEGAGESAPFAATVEDYRRAFAYAIATLPEAPPPTLRARLASARDYWVVGSLVGLLGSAVWAINSIFRFGMAPWEVVLEVGPAAIGVALAMAPAALIVSQVQNWDARGWRRRFPRERAAWKRPGRMRIRWSDTGLVVAGQEGFASFGWNLIHAWIDAPAMLVIFTGVYDPVPLPHAALAPEALDDLRRRLHAAGVPQQWRPMSGEALGLKRVFD